MYIPVYIADSEYTYEEMEGEMKSKLMALADDACTYIHGERYKYVEGIDSLYMHPLVSI